jgi:hypothetical protein
MRSATLFLSLFGTTAAQSVFYKLTNDYTKYTDGEAYSAMGQGYAGTTCDNRLLLDMTKYMDHPMVRDHLCVNKCAWNKKAAGCKHFYSDEYSDDPGGAKGGQERSCMMRKNDKGWYQDSKPIRGGNMQEAREDVSMEWDYMCGRVDDERSPDNANRRRSGLVPDDQLIGGGRYYFNYDPPAFTPEKIAAAKAAGIEFFEDYPNAFIEVDAEDGRHRPGKYELPQAKIDQLLCGTLEELTHIAFYVENATAISLMGEQLMHPANWISRWEQDKPGWSSDWWWPLPREMDPGNGGVIMDAKCDVDKDYKDCGVVGRLYEDNDHGSCRDDVNRYSMNIPHPILGDLCGVAARQDTGFERIEKAENCLQPQVDYWTQTYMIDRHDQVAASCPMGAAVEIFGGEHPVTGVYDEKYAGYYEHVGALPHKVMTTDENCGWQVRQHTLYSPPGGGGGGGGGGGFTCTDDDVAINVLMSQCDDPSSANCGGDPDFEVDMCKQLVSVWSDDQTIYCYDSLVAAVCRDACKAVVSSCSDGMDVDAPICQTYTCGEWPAEVDAAACPVKCARRLEEKGAAAPSKDVSRLFAERLRKVAKGVQGKRQLQASGYDQIVYTTCTKCNGVTTMGAACTDKLGSGGVFFGYKDFHSPIATTDFEVVCPASTTYTTQPGTYCKMDNVDTIYSTNPMLVDNRCTRKCGDRTNDTHSGDGVNDWCSGNRPDTTKNANHSGEIVDLDDDALALCLPREMCEALCTSLDDCVSIDMHRFLPRCYLNTQCSEPIMGWGDPYLFDYAGAPDKSTLYSSVTGTGGGWGNCPDTLVFTDMKSCMPKAGDGQPWDGPQDERLPIFACPCQMYHLSRDYGAAWDLLTKKSSAKTTGKSYPEDTNDDHDRVSFVTWTGYECVTTEPADHEIVLNPLATTMTFVKGADFETVGVDVEGEMTGNPRIPSAQIATRAACEAACLADDKCAGFQFTNLVGTFAANNYTTADVLYRNSDFTFTDGVCQFKTYSQAISGGHPECLVYNAANHEFVTGHVNGHDRVHPRMSAFVQKIPFHPCTVDVTVPGYEGVYSKRVGDTGPDMDCCGKLAANGDVGSRFERYDSKALLVYVGGGGDLGAGEDCAGWAIYSHEETETIELESCTDDPAAAKVYLESSPLLYGTEMESLFPTIETNFTCQWGADHGLCSTYVFPGLCALTCVETVPFTLDRGNLMRYMIDHGYEDFQEEGYEQFKYQDVDAKLYHTKAEFLDLYGTDSCDVGTPGTRDHHAANDGKCFANSTCPHNTDCTDCRATGEHGFFCDTTVDSMSTCAGDNNVAFFFYINGTADKKAYAKESDWYDVMTTACSEVITDTHFTYGDWPCSDWGDRSLIVRALCPETCAATWPGPPSPTDAPPNDESDPEGASSRRLATLSFSGRRTDKYMHTYVPGTILESKDLYHANHAYDGTGIDFTTTPWVESGKLEVQTWVSGAHDPTDPLTPFTGGTHSDTDSAYIPGTACSHGASFAFDPTKYDLLGSGTKWYRPSLTAAHGPMSSARVGHICRGGSVCPELTTCALTASRMHDELSVWRYSADVSRTAYLSTIDGQAKDQLFENGHYIPKVLTSTDRAEAIMVDAYFSTVKSIHRTDFGALRVTVNPELSATMKYLVVTMFDKEKALWEGGRYVPLPEADVPFYETDSPFQDVIRIDRFDEHTNGFRDGDFVFDVYVPYWNAETSKAGAPSAEYVPLDVYRFPPVISSEPVSILSEGGSISVLETGKIRITVKKTWGDFVIFQDKNECAGPNICDQVCVNELKGYSCACEAGYECSDGDCSTDGHYCRMKDDSVPDFYIRMSHTTRLDYGWRVKQVTFFSDEECSTVVDHKSLSSSDGQYPHGSVGVGVGKVNAAEEEWWSKCLTCNPEEVDDTHHGAAYLEWEFAGGKRVMCMKVEQSGTSSYRHVAKGLKIARGIVGGGMPTMTWTAECDGASCGAQEIALGCGMPNTVLFGEVLEPAGTETGGFYGSYGVGGAVGAAASACHCHELCIRHVGAGCRSYKYFKKDTTKHCILQTTKFLKYTSGLGAAPAGSYVSNYQDYTSGTPMDRFATGTKLLAGEPLVSSFELSDAGVLKLHGYGFPVKNEKTKADQARYQRIKLVPAGAKCTVEVPKEVSGIGCVETVLNLDRATSQRPGSPGPNTLSGRQTVYTICSTRPKVGSTSEMVEWEGITVLPGAVNTDYDACYCDGKKCSSPSSWVKIPGSKTILKNAYSYEVASSSFPRAPSATLTLTVHGAVGVPYADWDVKVVPAVFGCGVESPFTIDASGAPDYVVTVLGTVDDVGDYVVCYDDGSGFAPLEGMLTMTALPTDRTHARNVFREQRWSVAAGGAARELSIKGTGLPAVLDSKVVLAEGSTCEWPGLSFPGKKTFVPAADTVAPVVNWASSEPTTVVSSGTLIKLVFNEPVKSEGCEGNYSLKSDPASSVQIGYVACDDVQIVDNYILLDFSQTAENGTIADGKYFVIIDSYAILDMAGNYMLFQSSKDPDGTEHYAYTVGTDVTVPKMVSSVPEPSGLMTDGRIVISFSEKIFVRDGGRIDLRDCGEDNKCDSADPLLAKFHLNNTYFNGTDANGTTTYGKDAAAMYDKQKELDAAVLQKGYDMIVNVITGVDFTVFDYRRYSLTIPAGNLEDEAGNPTDADVEVEFLKDGATGFDPMNIIAAATSSPTGLTFDVQLDGDSTPGTYTMCYCNSNVDDTLLVQGDAQTTYKTTFGKVYNSKNDFTGLTVGSRDISEHICESKCHAGCIGSDCFCSGFDDAAVTAADAYCLSPDMCRETCDALGSGCAGFSTTDSNACILSATATPSDDGSFSSFEKMTGTACTDPHDFETPVGKITVTNRAHIGAEYVVEPSTKTTIEVAGSGLMADKGGIPFSSDRIMVVDCDGMCGYSDPSSSVTLEDGVTWHDLIPTNPLSHDPPHDMPPNPSYDPDHIASAFVGASGTCPYVAVDNVYCPGENYSPDRYTTADTIVYEGFKRKVSEHLCYDKCIATTCEGDDCFCEGAYPGYDGPSSNAFCADVDLCKMLCDNDDTCKSFDMSSDRTRCFLNVGGTCEYDPLTLLATASKPDAGYALYFKQVDQCEARRLTAPVKPTGRALLETMDFEYSHSKLLRYNGVTFTSGGSFKVCFCDATLLKPGETCSSPAHYGVEVGEVQASGISCLLKDSTYSRKTCYEMKPHGGLRCYDGVGPDTEAPRYNNDGTPA